MRNSIFFFALSLLLASPAAAQEFSPGHLFVADSGVDAVVEFDALGAKVREIGKNQGLVDPAGIAFGADGHLYVSSDSQNKFFEFKGDGSLVRIFGEGVVTAPSEITFGPKGNLYVRVQGQLAEVSLAGALVRNIPITGSSGPVGVAIGANGHLYSTEGANPNRVTELDADGVFIRDLASGVLADDPVSLTTIPDGRIYVSTLAGNIMLDPDGTASAGTSFNLTSQYASLVLGPDTRMYGARSNGTVERVGTSGLATTFIASGLTTPRALAFSPWRFAAKLTGTVTRGSAAVATLTQQAVLTILPGSNTTMLQWIDDTNKQNDFATLFGRPSTILHGMTIIRGPAEPSRAFHGIESGAAPLADGISSLAVNAGGKPNKQNQFTIAHAAGNFEFQGPGLSYIAKITTSKLLNK